MGGRTCRELAHTRGEHTESMQRGPFVVTILTITPPCCPFDILLQSKCEQYLKNLPCHIFNPSFNQSIIGMCCVIKFCGGARGPLFQNFVHFLQYAAVALRVCSFCSHTIELVSSIIMVSLLTCVEVLVRAPCRSDEAINAVDL